MKHKLYLVAFILAFISCDVTPTLYEGEPNICAIITADSTKARVMVGLTASVDDTLPVDTVVDTISGYIYTIVPWNGVSSADVVIRSTEKEYIFKEDNDSTGYYRTDSLSCEPGGALELEVSYPKGQNVKASTRIPGSFEVNFPEADTLFDTDTLQWTTSDGAAGYLIGFKVWWSFNIDTLIVDSYFVSPFLLSWDTTWIPAQTILSNIWGDSLRIYVSALDTNAYDYMYYGQHIWEGLRVEDYMHIPGAWGVFGSKVDVGSKFYYMAMPDSMPFLSTRFFN